MDVMRVSCRVIYGNKEGSVHMCLPIYIDALGACHAVHGDNELQSSIEEAIIRSICEGAHSTDAATAAALKRMMERVVERALQVEDVVEEIVEDADRL
ncbi:unnamed protein product [Closterium sp. NIES-53]